MPLSLDYAAAAAEVHRAALDDSAPWLAARRSPEEERWFYQDRVFLKCLVWGVVEKGELAGFLATRPGWIDQFHVLPGKQGRGIGGALLEAARLEARELSLWTFRRNAGARRFYEKRGFHPVACSSAEGEPDLCYLWRREAPVFSLSSGRGSG